MTLTAAHWLYAAITVGILVIMLLRRGIVLPALLGTLLVAWVYTGSFVEGLKAIFNANLVAAKELFNIFLIITFMVALLHALRDLGADKHMVKPVRKIISNGHIGYWIIAVVTYVFSLFFWPTPAVPLIATLLVPAAIRAGLPAMGAGIALALAGQGMALSSDYVMQVAPGLSAKAAGVDLGEVADRGLVLSLITGITALVLAYLPLMKQMRRPGDERIAHELKALGIDQAEHEVAATGNREMPKDCAFADTVQLEAWGKRFAVIVLAAMAGVIFYMAVTKLLGMGGMEGGAGAAFIGGVAAVLLILASVVYGRANALDKISDHLVDGFVFAFKAMGPVVPIAGFFFLGNGDFAGLILSLEDGAKAPGFLFDLVQAAQATIPPSAPLTALGLLIVGIITGLDGSGFSGLPLTGSLAGAFAPSSNVDVETLAAIGQMGAVWAGGGTIVAWSSLVAVAGFTGVSVMELARKNLLPVLIGLVASTVVAFLLW